MSDGWNDAPKPRRVRRKEAGKGGGGGRRGMRRSKGGGYSPSKPYGLLALLPSKESVQQIINYFGVVSEGEEDTNGGKYKSTRQQFKEMGFEVPEEPGFIDVYGNFLYVTLAKGIDPSNVGDLSSIEPISMKFHAKLIRIGDTLSSSSNKRQMYVIRSTTPFKEWGALAEYMETQHSDKRRLGTQIVLQKYQGWTELPMGDRGESFVKTQVECGIGEEKKKEDTVESSEESKEPKGLVFDVLFDKVIVASQPQKMNEPLVVVQLGDESPEDEEL